MHKKLLPQFYYLIILGFFLLAPNSLVLAHETEAYKFAENMAGSIVGAKLTEPVAKNCATLHDYLIDTQLYRLFRNALDTYRHQCGNGQMGDPEQDRAKFLSLQQRMRKEYPLSSAPSPVFGPDIETFLTNSDEILSTAVQNNASECRITRLQLIRSTMQGVTIPQQEERICRQCLAADGNAATQEGEDTWLQNIASPEDTTPEAFAKYQEVYGNYTDGNSWQALGV